LAGGKIAQNIERLLFITRRELRRKSRSGGHVLRRELPLADARDRLDEGTQCVQRKRATMQLLPANVSKEKIGSLLGALGSEEICRNFTFHVILGNRALTQGARQHLFPIEPEQSKRPRLPSERTVVYRLVGREERCRERF